MANIGFLAVVHRIPAAGVPCVPGYHGSNQDPDFLLQEAEKIGSFRRACAFQHLFMCVLQGSPC